MRGHRKAVGTDLGESMSRDKPDAGRCEQPAEHHEFKRVGEETGDRRVDKRRDQQRYYAADTKNRRDDPEHPRHVELDSSAPIEVAFCVGYKCKWVEWFRETFKD
jgi:hypothetical protein